MWGSRERASIMTAGVELVFVSWCFHNAVGEVLSETIIILSSEQIQPTTKMTKGFSDKEASWEHCRWAENGWMSVDVVGLVPLCRVKK